jgi:serine/threonine protein kinase
MTDVREGDILAGKYRVERVLGEGGMGVVVAVTHVALDERFAIKLMRPEAMHIEGGIERFLREARAAVKLRSEHVARVHDVGTLETGTPYLVMEYLEGFDLAHVLASRGKLPLKEAVDTIVQACDAIAEAHALGIIHRDLKPSNLFVTRRRDGSPLIKVLDFGISKVNVLGDRPESVTNSAVLLGSPAYMSPEQMKSSRDVGPSADVWSIGIILYEVLAGRLPFLETTLGSLMARVLTDAPPLAILEPAVPPEFLAVMGRCLEREPARRYRTATDLAVALAPFGSETSAVRVSDILSMHPAPKAESLSPSTLVSPLAATQHPSLLGSATTQASVNTLDKPSEARPNSRVRFWVTIAGLAAVAAAAWTFATTRGTADRRVEAAATARAIPTDEAEPTHPSVPPASPASPASVDSASPPLSASSSAPASSSPPGSASTALTTATTRKAHPTQAAPAHSSARVDAGDAFGSQRY